MSTDIPYAFIDKKCPRCDGEGTLKKSGTLCPRCAGTGIVGQLRIARVPEFYPTPFSELLRSTRERNGVTIRELSRRLGMSPSRLSGLETGWELPTDEEKKKIREWMEENND